MKKLVLLTLTSMLAGCGYSSKDNEMIGQVKKVAHATPLICGDYDAADISLGVMRNGVGSMSHEDAWVLVQDKRDVETLKTAADTGQIVKLTYDDRRVAFCVPDYWVTKVEVVK